MSYPLVWTSFDKAWNSQNKFSSILDEHATLTCKEGHFMLNRLNDAKILHNGKPLTAPIDLVHSDRLVFGTSQYYVFVDPKKASTQDQQVTFEFMQDEIGQASGIVYKDFKNMTQG